MKNIMVVTATDEELAKLVAEDVAKPVRPVGVNGQAEYWNVNAACQRRRMNLANEHYVDRS